MSCKDVYTKLNNTSYKSMVNVGYKLESIVNSNKGIIGYECLINVSQLSVTDALRIFEVEFNAPFLFLNLLQRITNDLKADNNGELQSLLTDKKLFINIERSCVCNRVVINQIVHFKNHLKDLNIELVLEVTERELSICSACQEISSGLLELSINQVNLAADDYDVYADDFRAAELSVYDYVKIEAPKTDYEYEQLKSFLQISNNKFNIIIERVESQAVFNRVCNAEIAARLQGYQGYTFGKSVALNI
ncbi:EAL domain-containing protein [Vibrio sp. TH_r3]|uniref:EAL domain-containing protein n=1 Tax=Vibrio sp. TH_r3 TaxID=3082084 RepID=UPI002953EF40|nr:EAL domain-containing protein [Vibrio sp. TH_r3]MDV7105983.1 EAL domain-containing protein [Vibrio sp. TH_r3]